MQHSEIFRYSCKGLLLDTNIFLLMVIGMVDRDLIDRFKRTNTFCGDDYDCLIEFLKNFHRFVVTPNILTEVSNLLGQLTEPKRSAAFVTLGRLTTTLFEIYVCSQDLSESTNLVRFGLTDAGLIDFAAENVLTLTDDFRLYGMLRTSGKDAINFNHLRTFQ